MIHCQVQGARESVGNKMYNKAILIGFLTQQAKSKSLPSGAQLVILNIETTHSYTKSTGESEQQNLTIDVNLYGRLGEIAQKYTKTGSKVLIEGRISMKEYHNQHGTKIKDYFIVGESLKLLDKKTD